MDNQKYTKKYFIEGKITFTIMYMQKIGKVVLVCVIILSGGF